jgi:hypothetical protein
MPDTLHDITVSCSDPNLQELLGDEYIDSVTNEVAEAVLNAYQSTVPIRTGELRNTELVRSSAFQGHASVSILDQLHVNSWTKPIPANLLAQILQDGLDRHGRSYLRSQSSQTVYPFSGLSGGSPTAGWKDYASSQIDVYLNLL